MPLHRIKPESNDNVNVRDHRDEHSYCDHLENGLLLYIRQIFREIKMHL
jgi:hypothetical protein